MIAIDSLKFSYNGKPTLDNVTLRIKEGEFAGIIGPNGAGKSTLIRMLSKMLEPASGSITLRGKPLGDISIRELAQDMAVLPAETFFAYDFTVREIVKMGRAPHLGFWSEGGALDDGIVERALEACGIAKLAERNIHSLSSGERQMVFLAQALAQEPKILLLDEPTVHLDIQHQIQVFRHLREWNEKRNMTVLVISHDLNVASQFCRRLILFHEGAIVTDGAPKEVLTEDNIQRVYGLRTKVIASPQTGLPAILFE